jgi:transposase
VHGRKRHLLVDTDGLILKALVSPAHITDRTGAEVVLEKVAPLLPRLAKIWADYGYRGKFVDGVRERFGWDLEIVTHRWTGITGVWAREGTVIDWEAIRPSGCPRAPQEVGRRADIRLDLSFTTTPYRR